MVFLAVSGGLFLTAALLINGQQRRTEFATAVRDFDSKLQSVIGNVATGYYNNTGQTKCTVSGGVITVTASGGTAGQNSDCTYIGQWVETVPSNDKFTITSYAGLRRTGSPPREVTNFADATPQPITATAENYHLPGGITAFMKLAAAPHTPFTTLAITTTFSGYSGGTLQSGSSRTDMRAMNSGILVALNPEEGFQICIMDGEQIGVIVLVNGTTRVTIEDGSTCP